jgi:hypothetical protein
MKMAARSNTKTFYLQKESPLIWNLDLGYRLTEDGNPPLDSVCQFAMLVQGHTTKILPNT